MYVYQLSINAYKNILEQTFHFDQHLNKIAGNNGAGKSSAVEAIFFAIQGTDIFSGKKSAADLITQGQDRCSVRLTLKEGEETYTVHRTIDSDGSMSCTILGPDGFKIPVKEAKSWLSSFTIDPLSFIGMPKSQQFDVIKKFAGIDTTAIDQSIAVTYQERTTAFQIMNQKIKASQEYENVDINATYTDVGTLSKRLLEIQTHNGKQSSLLTDINTTRNLYNIVTNDIESIEKQIAQLQKTLEEKKKSQEDLKIRGLEQKKALDEFVVISGEEDIAKQIHDAEENNKAYAKLEFIQQIRKEAEDATKIYNQLDVDIEKLRIEKRNMITSAKYPIEGMYITEDDGILIKGIPFDQYSSGQQLGFAIKLAEYGLDKPIKLVYIKNAALLDDKALEYVVSQSEFSDYTLILELVGENHVDSIVMRDGKILDPKV